jgi:hydrogenase expression/formation protein HypD
MELLLAGECHVEGFLAAGHVCTVAGFDSYEEFARKHRVPVVVTGFEPVDLLRGILACVRHLERGEAGVVNQYPRSAKAGGNSPALQLVDRVYEVCDRAWRGLGVIPRGGLRLRPEWSAFDAAQRFARDGTPAVEDPRCRSGEVLTGRIKPTACEYFAGPCTPESPLGAPMVSAEGACAAYFQYAAARRAASDGS